MRWQRRRRCRRVRAGQPLVVKDLCVRLPTPSRLTVGVELHDVLPRARLRAQQAHRVGEAVARHQVGGEADAVGAHGVAAAVVVLGHLHSAHRGLGEGAQRDEKRGEVIRPRRRALELAATRLLIVKVGHGFVLQGLNHGASGAATAGRRLVPDTGAGSDPELSACTRCSNACTPRGCTLLQRLGRGCRRLVLAPRANLQVRLPRGLRRGRREGCDGCQLHVDAIRRKLQMRMARAQRPTWFGGKLGPAADEGRAQAPAFALLQFS
jgi:hypothetical protein